MRAGSGGTLQPMVAAEKKKVRAEFGRLLNLELDRVGAPKGRGRIAWVHRNTRDKRHVPLVSPQAIAKWVNGKDIPDQANLLMLCGRLTLDFAALQQGASPGFSGPLAAEMQDIWRALPEGKRADVLRFARFVLGEVGDNPGENLASQSAR